MKTKYYNKSDNINKSCHIKPTMFNYYIQHLSDKINYISHILVYK
jgi:hypothetical protein